MRLERGEKQHFPTKKKLEEQNILKGQKRFIKF